MKYKTGLISYEENIQNAYCENLTLDTICCTFLYVDKYVSCIADTMVGILIILSQLFEALKRLFTYRS